MVAFPVRTYFPILLSIHRESPHTHLATIVQGRFQYGYEGRSWRAAEGSMNVLLDECKKVWICLGKEMF